MKDVARHASVSSTTVSMVLNGKAGSNIPPETQARVVAAAAELGYRPNAMARGLRRQRTDIFGVISDTIATTPYAGAMIQGAQDAAWAAGVMLMLVNTGGEPDMEQRAIELLLDRQVDAIVYATMYHRVVTPLTSLRQVRTVLLDARAGDASFPSVVPDDHSAAREAVAFLIDRGHRRIGFATTMDPVPAAIERLDGYHEVLEERGITFDPSLVTVGPDGEVPSGVEAAGRLLDLADPPTAIFCFNDRMAMGAYRAIQTRGLRVPEEVSVVGFDDMAQIAPWLDPPLTTMQLPHYGMGRWAVEQLLERDDPATGSPPVQYRMPCPLVERASVAQPRGR